MKKRFCPFCGTEYADGARYCFSCGASIENEPTPLSQPVYYPAKEITPGRGFGITAMILGILGLLDGIGLYECVFEIISGKYEYWGTIVDFLLENVSVLLPSILALIFGIIAIKRDYKNGISRAGIITASIGIALVLLFVILSVIYMDKITFINYDYLNDLSY